MTTKCVQKQNKSNNKRACATFPMKEGEQANLGNRRRLSLESVNLITHRSEKTSFFDDTWEGRWLQQINWWQMWCVYKFFRWTGRGLCVHTKKTCKCPYDDQDAAEKDDDDDALLWWMNGWCMCVWQQSTIGSHVFAQTKTIMINCCAHSALFDVASYDDTNIQVV